MPVVPPARTRNVRPLQFSARVAATGTLLLACGCAPAGRAPAVATERNSRWTYDHGGIVRGDAAYKDIALIFTGGDYGEGSGHILDALRRAGIRASFFLTGSFLAQPEHRRFVRRMVAEDHYVGPHSDSHPLYCAWEDRAKSLVTESFFRADLHKNIADLRRLEALGSGQTVYFVPPYEWYNTEQVLWSRKMGIALVNFTPGTGSNRDWIPEGHAGFVSSEVILADILKFERETSGGLNGFLLLLHLGSLRADKMHHQVGPLIDELSGRGYRFLRMDEMLPVQARKHE